MSRNLDEKGITILETTIALALFAILLTASFAAMVNISSLTGKLAVRQELLENARFAVDAITTSVRMSDAIKLKQRGDGSLLRLDVYNVDSTNLYFEYNTSPANRNRILQGSNELASYISKCDISIEGYFMRIHIETETTIADSSGNISAPLVFIRDIDIRYKEKR